MFLWWFVLILSGQFIFTRAIREARFFFLARRETPNPRTESKMGSRLLPQNFLRMTKLHPHYDSATVAVILFFKSSGKLAFC